MTDNKADKRRVFVITLRNAIIRRYAEHCRATCKEEQYTLHAASFLGPVKEAWKDYIGPEVQMGRKLRDVDISQFKREDGSVDVKAYERARRGLC